MKEISEYKQPVEYIQLLRLANFLNDEMGISHLETDQSIETLMDITIELLRKNKNGTEI